MKFLVAEKYKSCEIYRRMCDVYRKAYFSQKIPYKNGHATSSLCHKKKFMDWKHTDSPVKKKVLEQ